MPALDAPMTEKERLRVHATKPFLKTILIARLRALDYVRRHETDDDKRKTALRLSQTGDIDTACLLPTGNDDPLKHRNLVANELVRCSVELIVIFT